jgi:hypothetical protein
MEIRPILLLAALLAGSVAASEIYRWVDEDGVVHYSDQPRQGAERVILQTPNASRSPAPVQQRATAQDSADDTSAPQPFSYESLEIVAPAAEDTLWNIEGVLNVTLALTPGLQDGHEVRVYFDGTPQTVTGTSFQLQEVWRGVHNIQAVVVDEAGKVMIRSQPNRFYVQQNTVVGATL